MKKIVFVVIIVTAGIAVKWNLHQNETILSNITLENIEALASGESGTGTETCYHTITSKAGSKVMYCQTCKWVEGTYSWISSSGKC